MNATIRFRRAKDSITHRYYVIVNGFEIGWVIRGRDGTWSAYANSLIDSRASLARGVAISYDNRSRRWATDDLVTHAFYFLRYHTAPDDPKTPFEAWERKNAR